MTEVKLPSILPVSLYPFILKLWYDVATMDAKQIQRIEKLAKESTNHAQLAIKKSEELQAVLSLLEYRRGEKKSYPSVRHLFKKLKLA